MIPLAMWLDRAIGGSSGDPPTSALNLAGDFLNEPQQDQLAALAAELRAEIEVELKADREARWEDERRTASLRLQEQVALHAEEHGAQLAQSLESAVADMQSHLAGEIERLLLPLLSQSATALAHQEFAKILLDSLIREPAAALAIRGPETLLTALREKTASHPMLINFSASDDIEARAEFNDTVIETRITEFLRASGLSKP